jgi:hypothetical protein
MAERAPYALVAEFDRPDAILAAARKARERGFSRIEAFTPIPIEGLAEAVGFRERAIAPVVLAGAVLGGIGGFWMQAAVNYDFPLNVGGRPLIAWPAFMLIVFELAVLGAVGAGVLAMLLLDRLPKLHHPMFDAGDFHLASSDRFFLAILADDPKFETAAVRRFLTTLRPKRIEVAP